MRFIKIILLLIVILVGVILGVLFFSREAEISEVTMAKKLAPQTLKPLEETYVFSKDLPVIYVSAKVINPPFKHCKIRAEWIYLETNTQVSSDFQEVWGSNWIAFELTKPAAEFPTGGYKVNIFLDSKLAKEVSFQIE